MYQPPRGNGSKQYSGAVQPSAPIPQQSSTAPPQQQAQPGNISGSMTTGVCICCDNLLRFPQTVSCFRCTVCDTVNDLRPLPPPGALDAYMRSLTLTEIQRVREAPAREPANVDTLYKILGDAFAYHASLNEGFSNGRPPALDSPGIVLEDVRAAYNVIVKSDPRAIIAVMTGIERLLKRPGRRLHSEHDIKFLMIIMENPLLFNHGNEQESAFNHEVLGRAFGLLSCLSNELHHFVVNWFMHLPLPIFQRRVDLVNHFITYRLTRKDGMREQYQSDWGIRSAARVMALLVAANQGRDEKLMISDFYNTVVDYYDLITDYMRWQEEMSGSFSFCQYPFLISLGGKMQIMEADARRQMAERFKEAFFRTALHGLVTDPFLSLHIRRTALIQDSLTQLSSKNIDLKKRLHIEFLNEDGVDAGGLTKEWFLLLVRDLFDPQYAMFTYDEESNLCWFNNISYENESEYRLVGIVIGLAIYNSTILDVHFPLACYKKLLGFPVGLEDLKQLRPSLGHGLQKLLEHEGDDVEDTFALDFVVEYNAYGEKVRKPLVPNGEEIPVTSRNKGEYVERYASWVLNDSISSQFDAFKEGFYHVCGGNALSLFKPEEIEMMVRGGTELDIQSLESVTEYEGFDPNEPTIKHFWEIVNSYSLDMKRKLLLFITGTDRIPATGIQNMAFKISYMGEDSERLPISHTCFNQVCLYRYRTKEKLADKLTSAIQWSSGFGLK
ncbi:hypothetical protein BJ742DRAFT_795586 [Cladochytrium replicatum]|nr:hypothetical protein BJ742DRAFT_795586 [Cladochytrium replicatum]